MHSKYQKGRPSARAGVHIVQALADGMLGTWRRSQEEHRPRTRSANQLRQTVQINYTTTSCRIEKPGPDQYMARSRRQKSSSSNYLGRGDKGRASNSKRLC